MLNFVKFHTLTSGVCFFSYICSINNKRNMTSTNEIIRYENGKRFHIYSKMTAKGIRYYRYSSGRFFPISKTEINQRIILS